MKIKLFLKGKSITSKLMCVKIIKEFTGLGLKPAKDVADELGIKGYVVIDFPNENSVQEFSSEMKERVPEVTVVCKEYQRAKKILKLGLGDENAYRKFLTEMVVLSSKVDEEIVEYSLSIMNEEQLKKIFDKYESYI